MSPSGRRGSGSQEELIGDVRRTLRDQAGAIDVVDEPFDPTRAGLALDPIAADEPSRSSRPLVLAAVAAVVCLVAGVAVVVHHAGGTRIDAGAPAASAPWLTPTSAEKPMPTFPDGWQVLDYGAVRFAVPAGWVVVQPNGCEPDDPGVTGIVHVRSPGDPDPQPSCPAVLRLRPTLNITADVPAANGPQGPSQTVGTFTATGESSDCPPGCPSDVRLDNGYEISVNGPDAHEILGTFTDSGRVRALQAGPTLDRAHWHTVRYGRISFQMPPNWTTLDLPGSVTESTNAAGVITNLGGDPDPGECRPEFLPVGQNPIAFLGSSGLVPKCVYVAYDLSMRDGVWIRTESDIAKTSDDPAATTKVDPYVTVTVLSPEPTRPVVDLWLDVAGTPIEIDIAAGSDPAVARTILQSLRRY